MQHRILAAVSLGLLLAACGPAAPEPTEAPTPERLLEKTLVVDAPPDVVWETWTTTRGVTTFFAAEALVELRDGGPFELYFDPTAEPGARGSEGCVIVSFERQKRLEFTWNFPPHLPIRNELTRVVVTLEAVPPHGTRVHIAHRGWQQGAAWDEGYAYFDRAWQVVLERLAKRLREGPVDWQAVP